MESIKGPIKFGGKPQIPAPEVFANARKNQPHWYQIQQEAYRQFVNRPENKGIYANPAGDGATLEQVWLLFTLYGTETYCLLAHNLPEDQRRRITRLHRVSPSELIATLKQIQRLTGELNETTLHYDGTTGHCIRLTAYDPSRDRFIYHDPWPVGSLLGKENNEAGVDAQPEGTRWSVTSDELERVIFASFIFPPTWARVSGVAPDISFERWRNSDFFKRFCLTQIEASTEAGISRRLFSPTAFKDGVGIFIDSNADGRITASKLALHKRWIRPNAMLAVQIATAFVEEFAPEPSRKEFADIVNGMKDLRNPEKAKDLAQSNTEESDLTRCLRAFLGMEAAATLRTEFASVAFENTTRNREHCLEISIDLL